MGKDDDGNDQTFEEYVKKQVISQMKQNIILIKKADKYDCKLTHSEKQRAVILHFPIIRIRLVKRL